jgi:hypothetical protein
MDEAKWMAQPEGSALVNVRACIALTGGQAYKVELLVK